MADDMNNGSNFDPLASYARLSERVENQGRDIVDLRSNMNTGFRNIEGAVNALSTELRGSSKTQWPVLLTAVGVAFTILVAAGSQALSPIRENVTDLKLAILEQSKQTAQNFKDLAANTVSRQEMDWRGKRGEEDRSRMEAALSELRQNTITRAEWSERNRAHDQEMADANRRVDELRADFGSVYGTRDVIQDVKKEIDNLRQRLTNMMRQAPPP